MKLTVATLSHIAIAAGAGAQMTAEWIVRVEYEPGSGGIVSPAHPTATVRILAGFTNAYAFAGGDGDLLASDGQWLSIRLLDVYDPPGPPPPGTSPGTPVGSNIEQFIFAQIVFTVFVLPSGANPIPLWEGVWTTADFSARRVELETANTTRFSLYDQTGKANPITPAHGMAQIDIVPAPGTLALYAAAALAAIRRRRGHAHKEPIR
jgi:hypothetical protein